MGDDAGADEVLARIEEYRGPQGCWSGYERALTVHGAGSVLDSLVAGCERESPGSYQQSPLAFWHEFRMRRALRALANTDTIEVLQRERGHEPADWMSQQWAPFPLDLWRGHAYLQLGDTARARAAFARHIPRLEELRDEMPELSLRRRFLGIAYAGAGQVEAAIREADAARALALEGGDLWAEIPDVDEGILGILVLAGDLDGAFEVLGRMQAFARPGLLARLRTDPTLDPLRPDPRFEAIVHEVAAASGEGA